jgi:hypothetical protein
MGRERMFAKPFLGQLGNGHVQGVYSMCKVGALGGEETERGQI